MSGVKPEGNLYVACYPSTARCNGITYRGLLDTKVTHTMPSQTLGALPMWGRGSDLSSMTLSPICGIFQLNLTGTGKLSSILLDAGRPVSGEYLCSLSDGLFAMINGSDIILMDVQGTELSSYRDTPFYFILPPGEYDGLRLTLTAEDGTVKEQVLDETLVIEAGLFSLVRVEGLFRDQEQIDTYWIDINTGLPIPYEQTRIRMHDDGLTYPGDVIFADLNHNNMIDSGSDTLDDPGDQTIIGNTHPRFPYSFTLDLSWYGVYVSAFFQGIGKRLWNPTKEGPFWGQYCRPYAQAYKWQLDNCWTPENPDALLPKYTGYCGVSWQNKQIDRYMMDVSYIRLKNLQVGYNFPKKIIDKLKMSQLSVYFSAENLWTWSPMHKYTKDFDVVTVCYGEGDP